MYILVSAVEPNAADVINVSREIGKILNVVPDADLIWESFGLTLLKTTDNTRLVTYRGDYAPRCRGLLDYWRKAKNEGWNDVIAALKGQDDLKGLATRLDGEFKRLKEQLAHLEKSHTVQASNEPERGKFI